MNAWEGRRTRSGIIELLCILSCSDNTTAAMPQLQKPAPAFSGTAVVNGQFKDIKLSDYKGKYVVLFFYPLDL